VRCLKPNGRKAGGEWDATLCLHQVRYLGLLENLRVRRAGYCHRQLYPAFVTRYKVCGLARAVARGLTAECGQLLSAATWPVYRGDMRAGAEHVVAALGLGADVAFGRTKLFVKEPRTLYALEAAREARLHFVVAKIQAGCGLFWDCLRVFAARAYGFL
jgi:myosin-1